MKTILLLGAGKSTTFLIDYLLKQAAKEDWQLIVADTNEEAAEQKINGSLYGKALLLNVLEEEKRASAIAKADVVISMLPPAMHRIVALDCLQFKKHLLTASYRDAEIEGMGKEAEENGLLFLCEMGLDPGIDHLSAKNVIDEIEGRGGKILSFQSHCGGLVAPKSDDNPWHYKISWNPRNVVNAGKLGAQFLQKGIVQHRTYEQVFQEKNLITINDEIFCWYPNRDSVSYKALYGLVDCHTFIRTTLRHPDFIYGWKNLIELKFTDDAIRYDTNGMTLKSFFKAHFDGQHFSKWLEEKVQQQSKDTQNLMQNLANLLERKESLKERHKEKEFMIVNEKGLLQKLDFDDLENNAAATIAFKMHESKLTLRQLYYLGIDDDTTYINQGMCSAADVLQFILEKKLALQPNDKDLVVMMHEIDYSLGEETYKVESLLQVKGDDAVHTAMAKTVGLPLGIATCLLLKGKINLKGVHIPTLKELYEPVLKELAGYGISFKGTTKQI